MEVAEMPLNIELPEEMESRLRHCATLTRQSEQDIIRRALETYLAVPVELREELEAWQQLGAEAVDAVAPGDHEAW